MRPAEDAAAVAQPRAHLALVPGAVREVHPALAVAAGADGRPPEPHLLRAGAQIHALLRQHHGARRPGERDRQRLRLGAQNAPPAADGQLVTHVVAAVGAHLLLALVARDAGSHAPRATSPAPHTPGVLRLLCREYHLLVLQHFLSICTTAEQQTPCRVQHRHHAAALAHLQTGSVLVGGHEALHAAQRRLQRAQAHLHVLLLHRPPRPRPPALLPQSRRQQPPVVQWLLALPHLTLCTALHHPAVCTALQHLTI